MEYSIWHRGTILPQEYSWYSAMQKHSARSLNLRTFKTTRVAINYKIHVQVHNSIKLLHRCVSTATSVLHSTTYLFILQWPIRNATLCWVYNIVCYWVLASVLNLLPVCDRLFGLLSFLAILVGPWYHHDVIQDYYHPTSGLMQILHYDWLRY